MRRLLKSVLLPLNGTYLSNKIQKLEIAKIRSQDNFKFMIDWIWLLFMRYSRYPPFINKPSNFENTVPSIHAHANDKAPSPGWIQGKKTHSKVSNFEFLFIETSCFFLLLLLFLLCMINHFLAISLFQYFCWLLFRHLYPMRSITSSATPLGSISGTFYSYQFEIN